MAQYKYKALNAEGKKVTGTMRAADETELQQRLKERQLLYLSSGEVRAKKARRPFKAKVLAEFCRQIGTLTGAGVPLVRALQIVANQEAIRPKEKTVYEDILKQLRQGIALSDALESQNGAFPPLLVHMFRSAESSGQLDEVAKKMSTMYEKEHRMNGKISASLTYPRFLAVMIVVVVLLITNFILPNLQSLMTQTGNLPATTAILIAVSDFMRDYWYVALAGVILIWVGAKALMKKPPVRRLVHRLLLHLPMIGPLQMTVCTARFARTLSSLYAAGIPIVQALQIARKTTGNDYIDAQFDQVIALVRAGHDLSEGLQSVDGIVKKLSDSVMVGEETGSLDVMLMSASEAMEYDSDIAITKMVSYVEPAMLIIMGVIVAFVLAAVFGAMYGSYDAIAGMAS